MSSANVLNPRKPLFWLIGVAAAATFFASGALVARATDSDDDSPSKVVIPGVSAGEKPMDTPAAFPGATTRDGAGAPQVDASFPGCRAPLPAGVVTPTGFDPSKASFVPAIPGTSFAAISISFAAIGECDKDGNATSGDLQLETSWRHTATGLDAYVTQRASTEKVASVLRQDSATFWANGYVFSVGVNAYRILPVAQDAVPPAASGSGSAASGSGGANTATTVAPGQPTADPRAAQVLREIIAQLSPSTDLKCFWKAGPGDWTSLAGLGIGDPRPAIPAGFTQQELNVTAFTAPEAPCDTSLKPTEGFNFSAGWQKQDSNGFAYLGVSVYANGSTEEYPGNISQYGANWTRNGLQFGVYAKSEKPLGIDLVRAIAKALDPQFNEACFIQERELNEAELAGLGFSAAKAPAGYKLERQSLHASEIAAGCQKPAGFQPTYSLSWAFSKGADVINAGANRFGAEVTGNGTGFRTPNNLNWSSANGTQFYVNASSSGINPNVPLDDLVAVARSMDPSFDLSKLTEQPGGPEKPLPVERSAR